jgi:hypothetical protein
MKDSTGFDIEHVSLINYCNCCFYSPSVYLFCSVTGQLPNMSSTSETNDTVRELFRVSQLPALLFDVSLILRGQMNAKRFERNFCLTHVIWNETTHGDTFSHLAKTLQVVEVDFYKRLYVLHLCVNIIVNWLWARQRVLHASLNGKNAFIRHLPPVMLYVTKDVVPLLRQVATVPFLVLEKTRKIIVHVV